MSEHRKHIVESHGLEKTRNLHWFPRYLNRWYYISQNSLSYIFVI